MKTFQLIHVCQELGARSIIVSENEIAMYTNTPAAEIEAAMKLGIGEKMIFHFGTNPVKTGNLIRKG